MIITTSSKKLPIKTLAKYSIPLQGQTTIQGGGEEESVCLDSQIPFFHLLLRNSGCKLQQQT